MSEALFSRLWPLILLPLLSCPAGFAGTGQALAEGRRPAFFPHRVWVACDFEGATPDYGWFGVPETNNIPKYPGNRTALSADRGQKTSTLTTGINPVPGPRMGKENWLYLRYFLKGSPQATFQHFSLTQEDNWHIKVSNLATGRWSEVALNFTRHGRRNDGSLEAFQEGERMDDFKIFTGLAADSHQHQLLIDDVIFFANDPSLPGEPEPFPNRIIFLAAFDTGPKDKYWPGDFELWEKPPAGGYWRAARSIPMKDGKGQMIRLEISPPRPVGPRTKLRFRYYLTGALSVTVQIFDATVQDNRHILLSNPKQDQWTTVYLDFSRDSRRNDGTAGTRLGEGHLVDDLFFFVRGEGSAQSTLMVDEVVLYDAVAP